MTVLWRRVEFRLLLIAFGIVLNSIIADSCSTDDVAGLLEAT
jgi:hypothetical protein